MNKLNRRIPEAILGDLMLDMNNLIVNIVRMSYYYAILTVLLIIVFWTTDEEGIFATVTMFSIIGIITYIVLLTLYKMHIIHLNFNQVNESIIISLLNPLTLFIQAIITFLFGGFVQMSIYDETMFSQIQNVLTNTNGYIVGFILAGLIIYSLSLKKAKYSTKDFLLKIESYMNEKNSYTESVKLANRYFNIHGFSVSGNYDENIPSTYEEEEYQEEVYNHNDDYYEENNSSNNYDEIESTNKANHIHTHSIDEGKMVRKRR